VLTLFFFLGRRSEFPGDGWVVAATIYRGELSLEWANVSDQITLKKRPSKKTAIE
jgi:hypothetical protein